MRVRSARPRRIGALSLSRRAVQYSIAAIALLVAGSTPMSELLAQSTPAQRPMTFLDMQRIKSAGSFTPSVDGRWLLHTVTTPDWEDARSQTDIHLVSVQQGLPSSRQMTFSAEKNETAPAWSRDGSFFAFLSNRDATGENAGNQVYAMRPDGGEARKITSAAGGVSNFAFSKDGQWAGLIWTGEAQAQLWGVVPSQEYHTFLNPFDVGESVSQEGDLNPDGTLLALATSDGVRLWDVLGGRAIAWLPINATTAAVFRKNGRELLTCGASDGLQRWRIAESSDSEHGLQVGPPHRIPLPFAPMRIAKGRDDQTLAVVGERPGQAVMVDLETETLRLPGLPHDLAGFVALSPDGRRLATSGWHSERVKLWDGQSGKLLKELETGLSTRVYFTPDNQEMIVARANEFTFRDLETLEVNRRMPRETGLYPGFVAFTADGKLMALEMAPGLIHLKELASGRIVAKLEDPQGDLSTWMSFTPDGTQLVVAARYAGAIHRWDLRAIRARLKTMNLDWEWPEFSPPPARTSFSRKHQPPRVQVVGPQPTAGTPESATNAIPANP